MNIFKRINKLYIRARINKEEWEHLTNIQLKKFYDRGLLTKEEFKKYE